MADQTPPSFSSNPDFLAKYAKQWKLTIRLLGDKRISLVIKLLYVVGTLLYFFMPDLIPGPIDDVTLFLIGPYLFPEICPKKVVNEHLKQIKEEDEES